MSPPERANEIAARFAASGFPVRMEDCGDFVRIELELPESVGAESWHEVLELFRTTDGFGLTTCERGHSAWVVITKETPDAASRAGRGRGRQLRGS